MNLSLILFAAFSTINAMHASIHSESKAYNLETSVGENTLPREYKLQESKEDCETVFGFGFVRCGRKAELKCYNPSQGEVRTFQNLSKNLNSFEKILC
jgi:hypothetical protein